ncbi:hypothetical protein HNO89_000469 [Sporosarcina luteola]|nr:hypothetical protein [Sporosarcina luteola]
MLKILRFVFAAVAFLFAAYGLLTKDYQLQPFMMVFLGFMMLIMGLEEFQKNQKFFGWLFVGIFLFALYVAVQGFLLLINR